MCDSQTSSICHSIAVLELFTSSTFKWGQIHGWFAVEDGTIQFFRQREQRPWVTGVFQNFRRLADGRLRIVFNVNGSSTDDFEMCSFSRVSDTIPGGVRCDDNK
jgi:hypothetical protein